MTRVQYFHEHLPPRSPQVRTLTLTRALSCARLCSCCNDEGVKTRLKCEESLARSQVVTPCKLWFEGQDMFPGKKSPKVQIFCCFVSFMSHSSFWVTYCTMCSPVNSTHSYVLAPIHCFNAVPKLMHIELQSVT